VLARQREFPATVADRRWIRSSPSGRARNLKRCVRRVSRRVGKRWTSLRKENSEDLSSAFRFGCDASKGGEILFRLCRLALTVLVLRGHFRETISSHHTIHSLLHPSFIFSPNPCLVTRPKNRRFPCWSSPGRGLSPTKNKVFDLLRLMALSNPTDQANKSAH